jgi:hypothetical protein
MVGSLNGKKGLIPDSDSTIQPKNFGSIQERGAVIECWAGKTYKTVIGCVARNSAKNGTPYGFRVVGPKDILPTVTCSFDGGATRKKVAVIDKKGKVTYLRHPTVLEGARAQGFPDSWVFPESRTKAWNFIGDAVSSPVAKAIAEHLKLVEAGKKPPCKKALTAKRISKYVQQLGNDMLCELPAMQEVAASSPAEDPDFFQKL